MDDIPIVGSLVVRGHTPGTWSVSRDGVPFGGTDINVVSKTYRKAINADHVIASIRTVSDQWESNAALIAAAPELLAALRSVREVVSEIEVEDPLCQLANSVCHVIKEIDKAIDKAEGKVE